MNISDINPHARYARVHRTVSEASKKESICYDCRLFYIENASGYLLINGARHTVSSGTAIYLPPKTKYKFSIKPEEDFQIIVMDFDLVRDFCHLEKSLGTATAETYIQGIAPEYELPELLSQPIARRLPEIKQPLIECTDLFLSRAAFFLESSSALLKLCLIELIRKNRQGTLHTTLCDEVVSFIHENYANSALTNAEIAAKFNYNPYHLSHIMKEQTGKSLHKYLIFYRIRIAKNYLLTTHLGIDEISWRSGFCTSAYFIKIFRQQTGMTPKKYRDTRFHAEL